MPAGVNGKLYGAVTNQTVAEELAKNGFQIERKRIDIFSNGIKNVGKYKAVIRLYENQLAEVTLTITAQEIKVETPVAKPAPRRERRWKSKTFENPQEEETKGEKAAKAGNQSTTPS
jgi:large subunit ribosomal protein L9